jgi:hypothetical protein
MNDLLSGILTQDEQLSSDYAIDKLCLIIFDIIEIHKVFSTAQCGSSKYNLKKTLVKHIMEHVDDTNTYIINKDFHLTIKNYLDEVEQLTIDIELEYIYSEFDFRLRVKQPESIIYKLGHYNSGKSENGRIPMVKCLNDLLGFRIILPGFSHDCELFKKMCDYIDETYKIRYRNSSKGEYKATHIYFYGENNKNFPWELQIWLPDHYDSNYKSHAEHKQDYISSARIHKEFQF